MKIVKWFKSYISLITICSIILKVKSSVQKGGEQTIPASGVESSKEPNPNPSNLRTITYPAEGRSTRAPAASADNPPGTHHHISADQGSKPPMHPLHLMSHHFFFINKTYPASRYIYYIFPIKFFIYIVCYNTQM